MAEEHKPMTEEELAEIEALLDFSVEPVMGEFERRGKKALSALSPLIAEVRRLRVFIENQDKWGIISDLIARSRPSLADYAVLIEGLDPTLTLSNGTVVRVGDVLVPNLRYTMGAIRVTGVGENCFLARTLLGDGWGREQQWAKDGFDCRPWSEVYPDRPVPRGER